MRSLSAAQVALLEGYSQALYSTWVAYRPFHVLCDCGEGLAPRLGKQVFGFRTLLLSHGHLDHVSGLPSLVNIRNNALGDPFAPLTVAYPAGDPFVGWMRDYIQRSNRELSYPLTWLPLEPGAALPLDDVRTARAFRTAHEKGLLTLGWRITETRRRLRPELRGQTGPQLRDLAAREGPDAVSEACEHPLLVYGGDGLPPAAEHLAGADIAVLDATFLDLADRGRPSHATLDEAVDAAAEAGVRTLVLMHVSTRYSLEQTRATARAALARTRFPGEVRLLWRERLLRLQPTPGETHEPEP